MLSPLKASPTLPTLCRSQLFISIIRLKNDTLNSWTCTNEWIFHQLSRRIKLIIDFPKKNFFNKMSADVVLHRQQNLGKFMLGLFTFYDPLDLIELYEFLCIRSKFIQHKIQLDSKTFNSSAEDQEFFQKIIFSINNQTNQLASLYSQISQQILKRKQRLKPDMARLLMLGDSRTPGLLHSIVRKAASNLISQRAGLKMLLELLMFEHNNDAQLFGRIFSERSPKDLLRQLAQQESYQQLRQLIYQIFVVYFNRIPTSDKNLKDIFGQKRLIDEFLQRRQQDGWFTSVNKFDYKKPQELKNSNIPEFSSAFLTNKEHTRLLVRKNQACSIKIRHRLGQEIRISFKTKLKPEELFSRLCSKWDPRVQQLESAGQFYEQSYKWQRESGLKFVKFRYRREAGQLQLILRASAQVNSKSKNQFEGLAHRIIKVIEPKNNSFKSKALLGWQLLNDKAITLFSTQLNNQRSCISQGLMATL